MTHAGRNNNIPVYISKLVNTVANTSFGYEFPSASTSNCARIKIAH